MKWLAIRLSLTVQFLGFAFAAFSSDHDGAADESCSTKDLGTGKGACPSVHQGSGSSSRRIADDEVDEMLRTRKASLIEQELEELSGLAVLYQKRIAFLEELRAALSQGLETGSLPQWISSSHAQALNEPLPRLSQFNVGGQGFQRNVEATGTGDYVITKAILPQGQEVSFLKFLPLRNPRSAGPTPSGMVKVPSTLLLVGQVDGTIRLFTPSGELTRTFSAGHDAPITRITTSPLHDEYLIVTCDALSIARVHRVSVRQRFVTKEERQARKATMTDKVSEHLGLQANVTVQYTKRFRLPNGTRGESSNLTDFVLCSQQGTKYFIAADDTGNFTVFTRNGTRHARFSTGMNFPIESVQAQMGTVVFVSAGRWGLVDLENLEARFVHCPGFTGRVSSATVDSHYQTRVLVSDEFSDVWVFSLPNKKACEIEHRFPSIPTDNPPVSLGSIRGFALALNGIGVPGVGTVLTAFNTSHSGKKRNDPARVHSPIVWRKHSKPIRSWALYKRYQQGDLAAFLYEDGLEVEVIEILMQAYVQPPTENFGNFKLPVFAIAIVMVLAYQYVKGQGAFDPNLVPSDS